MFQHVSSGPCFRLTTKPTRGFNSSNIMVNGSWESGSTRAIGVVRRDALATSAQWNNVSSIASQVNCHRVILIAELFMFARLRNPVWWGWCFHPPCKNAKRRSSPNSQCKTHHHSFLPHDSYWNCVSYVQWTCHLKNQKHIPHIFDLRAPCGNV